ncbi:CRISPR-associated endonuclease Cas3'' [Pectinatus frisingensis]|uniref:CRISPR-associated endonuclease Cas3'' n=1 Tax=Pectinatus frisingensis TaxID=865 RepID=UPI0018C77518|nr:CRISPR-associated endonuclease Cas3'' [Pectinatus frisingensis]
MEYKQADELLAHKEIIKNKEYRQYLKNHLYNTAVYAKKIGSNIGLKYMGTLIGILHDAGKASYSWQQYINRSISTAGDHSTVGGYYIQHFLYPEIKKDISLIEAKKYSLYNEFLIYPILAHHGLYDVIKNENSQHKYWTHVRMENTGKSILQHPELKEFFPILNEWSKQWFEQSLLDIYIKGYKEFLLWQTKMQEIASKSAGKPTDKMTAYDFYCGTAVRLLLSILKEADIYDSVNWCMDKKQHIYDQDETLTAWHEMNDKIENKYKEYHNSNKNDGKINSIRTALADEAFNAAEDTPIGCYTLPMPVGAGKTMTALRYALRHSMIFKNKRILYVTAFLAVLEQNADEIEKVIGTEHVFEHHSNVIIENEISMDCYDNFKINQNNENEYDKRNYLKESWEEPFIVTTLVQLSNTLFKGQSACLRRFSKLIDTVIIIDEIQSLPVRTIYLFNLIMNFLTHFMGVTIIHCTATLPSLGDANALIYPCLYGMREKSRYIRGCIVPASLTQNEVFSRVKFYSLMGSRFETVTNTKRLIDYLGQQLQKEKSILVIVNTRAAVKTIYNAVQEYLQCHEQLGGECYYLTTNLCAVHRLKRINKIKLQLNKIRNGQMNTPLICISTRLIEAGINIDFDVVYRSLTSIDSVLQAAGRCNREGKRQFKGKVFVFLYQAEKTDKITTFRLEQEAAKETLRCIYPDAADDICEIDMQQCLDMYYAHLYTKNKDVLNYPIRQKNDTIMNWLTTNNVMAAKYNRDNSLDKHIPGGVKTNFKLRQSFKMAAQNFELIDNKQKTVIVQYENNDLINELLDSIEDDWEDVKIILQKLQRYTVNIYNLQKYENYIQPVEKEGYLLCYLLDKNAYDEEFGLIKGEMNDWIY